MEARLLGEDSRMARSRGATCKARFWKEPRSERSVVAGRVTEHDEETGGYANEMLGKVRLAREKPGAEWTLAEVH